MIIRVIVPIVCAILLPLQGWPGERTAAVVNGTVITESDVEDAVRSIVGRQTFHGNLSGDRYDEYRDRALESLIDQELQYQDASRRGIKPDRKELRKQMDAVRSSFPTKAEYRNWLERKGMTEDELEARFRKNLVVRAAVEQFINGPAQVTEKELMQYYTENREQFIRPETVRLRMFYSKNEQKARDALNQMRAGEDFGMLAARLSEDNYRIKGGDIGYVHRGRIYPELEEVAFSMKVGEISGLIKAEGAWFILKVEDRQAERHIPFEEAKDQLHSQLGTSRRDALLQQWLSDLRSTAKIERPTAKGPVSP